MGAAEELMQEQSPVLAAFEQFEPFCRAMLDAYAVLDKDGRVVRCNQLLSQLLGQKTKQIMRAASLEQMIQLYVGSTRLGLADIVGQATATRLDEVRGILSDGKSVNIIMGVYPFKDSAGQAIGAFILMRDVTAETNLQGKYKDAHNKSITDPLTTLFTRAYFEDFLRLQGKLLRDMPPTSEQRLLSIAMLDIDFFKKVNDVHGHPAGDHILKVVSGIMKKNFRKTDILCRYGGEEFLVILPGTDLQGAFLAAEKFRASIEAERIEFEGKHIPVTISSGVSQWNLSVEDYVETIARADQALYQAKKGGRNRVQVAK